MNWPTTCETILTALGYPFDYQRYDKGTGAQLPDTYIVYFLVDDPPKTSADGVETSHMPRIQISLYYRDKSVFLTAPDAIEAAFMAAGFLRVNGGSLPYDADTGHNGWRCDFRTLERRD